MMRIFLIFNVGSTSVKSRLIDQELNTIHTLNADFSPKNGLIISGLDTNDTPVRHVYPEFTSAEAALRLLLEHWQLLINAAEGTLCAIGHRIVHGGAEFTAITPLNAATLARIAHLDNYAPLHNPLNRLGIRLAHEAFPAVPQFGVFDTAFHRQIPDFAGRYALPENLSATINFYRYGFHGISCQHSVSASAELLDHPPVRLNLIILHLGGGASVTAVRNGISVDTSMGFSPTEGVMMASRCGDIDCMIPLTLQQEGMSLQAVTQLLNHESGLRGVCGDSDMRSILARVAQQDVDATLALEMFCYRIKKYIGAYCAVLGEITALVFTGGIGEHAPQVREKIVQGLAPLGFELDPHENNQTISSNRIISSVRSRSTVLIIHAEEEREIARQIINAHNAFT